MEQRILQYRKSIDEWLEKTEQSAQVSQEILRDKMEEHLNQIGFFQHERLIHLIVTVTFALLEMLAILERDFRQPFFTLTSGGDSDFACSVYSSLLYFGK